MPRPPSPHAASSPMAASFDFPPASASPRRTNVARAANVFSRSADFLSGGIQERDQAHRERSANDSEDWTDALLPPRRPRVEPTGRRTLRRPHAERVPPEVDNLSRRPTLPTTSSRPRATPSERYLRRSRVFREQRSIDMEPGDSYGSFLDAADSDIPNSVPFSGLSSRRSLSREPEGQRRQPKRRKLDHSAGLSDTGEDFRYGYKGQVVPGRLQMDIVSCDGGEYRDSHSPQSMHYRIQNVLKNDKSVYCTQSSRCNLLLKHVGETPFALEKVVIRAPDRGFTAPVQEGLIFVSMSPDELISRTKGYRIEYESPPPPPLPPPPPHRSASPSSVGDAQISLLEAVEDPYIWENSRQDREEAVEERIERINLNNRRLSGDLAARARSARRTRIWSELRGRIRQIDAVADLLAEHCEPEDTFATAGISAPSPPPFTITTETDEETEEDQEQPSAAVLQDRLRRESRWRADSDEDDDPLYSFPPPRRGFQSDFIERYGDRVHGETIRATRLRTPSAIVPKDPVADSDGLIAPHARFFIAKNKNKITIKFHPAISGKFVLLKLWSPTSNGNIDIESVQFHGYSGPRFFPAAQPV